MKGTNYSALKGIPPPATRALALFPIFAIACFYSFVLRARLTLGAWPTYNHPDPKVLGFDWHYIAVTLALVALPVAALVTVLYSFAGLAIERRVSAFRLFLPIFVLFGLAFTLAAVDPGGFFSWFGD